MDDCIAWCGRTHRGGCGRCPALTWWERFGWRLVEVWLVAVCLVRGVRPSRLTTDH